MAAKHGYKSADEYKEGVQKKFSLLETGIIDKPSTRLLLINGTLDGLMPIEDSLMLFEHGTPKEARYTITAPTCARNGYIETNSRANCTQVLLGGLAHGVSNGKCVGLSLDGKRHGQGEHSLKSNSCFFPFRPLNYI